MLRSTIFILYLEPSLTLNIILKTYWLIESSFTCSNHLFEHFFLSVEQILVFFIFRDDLCTLHIFPNLSKTGQTSYCTRFLYLFSLSSFDSSFNFPLYSCQHLSKIKSSLLYRCVSSTVQFVWARPQKSLIPDFSFSFWIQQKFISPFYCLSSVLKDKNKRKTKNKQIFLL